MARQLAVNQWIVGSNPTSSAEYFTLQNGGYSVNWLAQRIVAPLV